MAVRRNPAVLVVDAHPVIASALAVALRHSGFPHTGAMHPDEIDRAPDGAVPPLTQGDVVLLGLLYGDGRTALPLIGPLSERGYRVVVMTVDQGLPLAGECLRRGAEAVLDKDMSFDRLLDSLTRLGAGEKLIAEQERAALLEIMDDDVANEVLLRPFSALTEREAEVLAALVDGRSPKQIARDSDISLSTVRGHIQRVLRKLDVSSQREALAMARCAAWPPPAGHGVGRTD